jgi:DNA-binding transcriptional LysR family regulator
MGAPKTLDELSQHRLAAHSIVDVRNVPWTRNGAALKFQQSLPKPRWLVNDSAALERFALSGAGLALLMTLEGDAWAERG